MPMSQILLGSGRIMSKYVANAKDIPMNAVAKKLLGNIHTERKEEEYELIKEENPELLPNIDLSDDFALARNNISKLLEISAKAIDDYYEFATTSASPKAVEVLSNMIKDTVDMNKNLIELHQQRERINSTKITNGQPINHDFTPKGNIGTQNNIMLSPSDMIKLIRDTEEPENITKIVK